MKSIYSKIFLGSLALALMFFANNNLYSAGGSTGTTDGGSTVTTGAAGPCLASGCKKPKLGDSCGEVDDGCGGTISCGCGDYSFTSLVCSNGQCARPSTATLSGDTPKLQVICKKSCDTETPVLGDPCGAIDDNCGGTISCGCGDHSFTNLKCSGVECVKAGETTVQLEEFPRICLICDTAHEGSPCGTLDDRCGGTVFCKCGPSKLTHLKCSDGKCVSHH